MTSVETRSAKLDSVLRLAQQAFLASTQRPDSALPVASKIFSALETHGDGSKPAQPATLAVCEHIAPALHGARQGPACIAELADAFEALTPRLEWWRRPGTAAGEFFDGHANARLVGPRGLEQRDDVIVGASLVAPGVSYPDHHHLPEEIYVVLTPGEWRQQARPWHTPGPGGVVHNPSNIVHAMRAGDAPLLALWFLWLARS
jgi:quercetin dioxygenase-like cupin family protein